MSSLHFNSTETSPTLVQLWSFGTPTIHLNNRAIGALPAKGLALLTYLAITQQSHSRTALANLLWDGVTEDKALANLRKVLQALRAELPDSIIVARQSISLSPEQPIWVDANAFAEELAHALAVPNPVLVEQALNHYKADFLTGFYVRTASDFEAWQAAQQAILREMKVNALKQLSQIYIDSGELSEATTIMRQVLDHEPWREEAHRQLMRLLFDNGETAQALLQYERCCQLLDMELGVPPSVVTQQLYEQIRSGNMKPFGSGANRQPRSIRSSGAPVGFTKPKGLDLRVDFRASKELFGIEELHESLVARLQPQTRPWLVVLDGIGGIGKTALAQSLLTTLSQSSHFERMAWVSARQEEFEPTRGTHNANRGSANARPDNARSDNAHPDDVRPDSSRSTDAGNGHENVSHACAMDAEQLVDLLLAQLVDSNQQAGLEVSPGSGNPAATPAEKEALLQQVLAEKPTLVVVDNLETIADYTALLPILRGLSNPSKFLLTSRYSLAQYGDVYSQTLRELAEEDVFCLLRHEASMRGLSSLTNADDDTLAQIYAVAGGHPLALNLILGQLNFLPMDHVLEGLQQRSNQRVEDLYAHIYWQTWQLLDEPTRQLLCIMPLLHNATYDQLGAITELPTDILQAALTQLINLSLLNMDGDLFEPRYALHRLTETFLDNILLQKSQAANARRQPEQEQYRPELHRPELHHLELPSEWRAIYVQSILNGLSYWQEHPAVTAVDVAQLDRNRESIINLLNHGLRFEAAWPQTCRLIVGLASYMERRGHWRTWRVVLERAVDMAQNANDIDGETVLTALLGRLSQRQGRGAEVVRNYRRVLHLAKPQNNQHEIARAYTNLGYHYIEYGHWWRSEQMNLRALEIFEELDSIHGQAHTCNHLGMLYTRMERWDQAQAHLERACLLWRNSGDQHGLFAGQLNLGLMYVEMDAVAEAMICLKAAQAIAQQTGELSNTARIWNNIAVAHKKNSAWQDAEECAKKAESLFQEYADERGLASAWENMGTIYADIEQTQRAAEYFGNALAVHRKFKNQPDIERIHAAMSAL